MSEEATSAAVRVECYSGYRGEETPRRFFRGDEPVEIDEVLDRWLAPDHRYFKVRGEDGVCCILRQDVETGRWRLIPVDLSDQTPSKDAPS